MAMMYEFLQLNNRVASNELFNPEQNDLQLHTDLGIMDIRPLWLTFCFCPSLPLFSEDKAALAKLVEAIKTNYNDRYEEVSLSAVVTVVETNTLQIY